MPTPLRIAILTYFILAAICIALFLSSSLSSLLNNGLAMSLFLLVAILLILSHKRRRF